MDLLGFISIRSVPRRISARQTRVSFDTITRCRLLRTNAFFQEHQAYYHRLFDEATIRRTTGYSFDGSV